MTCKVIPELKKKIGTFENVGQIARPRAKDFYVGDVG